MCFACFVFCQARNLPAADSNGLMDPYLKIKFDGKVRPKTTSYGAGYSKFLKSEIWWISDFGRKSASQQKNIFWDSGNWKLNEVVMEAYSMQNDWLKK